MTSMQAVRLHGVRDLRVEEVAAPQGAEPGEIIVDVEAAGICGSDLHNYRTGMWLTRTPSIPGHEFCGTVASVGDGVEGLIIGDRIIADSRVFCGACDMCAKGRTNLCRAIGYVGEVIDGGFAPRVKLKATQVHKLRDQSVAAEIAAMAEPLAVALHAIARLEPRNGEPVLITGAGPIGAITAIVLAHKGFGPLLIADRNVARREQVAALAGAKEVELAGLAAETGNALSFCVETTGAASVLAGILPQMGPGARIASVGIFHNAGTLDLNRIVEGEIDLVGCAAFGDELGEANALLGVFAPKLAKLASAPISLADVPEAYESLIAGDSRTIKTIIHPALQAHQGTCSVLM
jgi:(R,R)-butanediol dehydrogenase/meso-butanediol dehydrogenase/diacetyl reductase